METSLTRPRLLFAAAAALALTCSPAIAAQEGGATPTTDSGEALAAGGRVALGRPVPGKGPRDLAGYWSPLRPASYADYSFPADVLPQPVMYVATKDKGRLVEKIDEYLQPWAREARRTYIQKNDIDGDYQITPEGRCMPYTMPGEFQEGVFPLDYIQTEKVLVLQRFGESVIRTIHIGGEHPKNLIPSWLGHSVGKWEADTLVVDTVGFNGKNTLFPGLKHTDKLHMTARYRLLGDGGVMEVIYTYDDPGSTLKPIKFARLFQRSRTPKAQETVCGQNNKEAEGAHGST